MYSFTRRPAARMLPLLVLGMSGVALADAPMSGPRPLGPLPSVHQDQMLRHPIDLPAADSIPLRTAPASPGPDLTVYGYWPYWGDPISSLPFDSLTHLAIFGVTLTSDGTLTNTGYWTNYAAEAVSLAHAYGVKVHMTVICFDTAVMGSVFPSASKRATAIAQIQQLVDAYGADGANLDVEGLPSSQKANFITFVKELRPKVDQLYLATPAVDWSGAYDYDVLAADSDGLFIMGYAYHYGGGNPGPVAPLYGGSPWGSYSLEWTLNDYQTYGTPLNKTVLGLPLYGYNWPTTNNSVPGTSTGKGTAMLYTQAVASGLQYGRKWDSLTHTPYAFPSTTSQLWYDDLESLEDKIAFALARGIQGIGFWALTYEDADPTFWGMVDSYTTFDHCMDNDMDGVTDCDGDCNDANPAVNPRAAEACDGLDNNCDGVVDNAPDQDGDGVNACRGDCNDGNGEIYPGAPERCDGWDNNCDGLVDNAMDEDGDGLNSCEDCNDQDATVHPGAPEYCDGVDNDCDGQVDNAVDADQDGVSACQDCDDQNAAISPNEDEVPRDGLDNDCDGQIDESDAGGCSGGQPARQSGGASLGLSGVALLGLMVRRMRRSARRV